MDNIKNRKPKRKIKYKNILICIIIIGIIITAFCFITSIRVKNIYVNGNKILSEQQIIDMTPLKEYPTIFSFNKKNLKKLIKENVYVNKVNIKYKNFRQEINIDIEENEPVLYSLYDEVTILSDGSSVKDKYDLPVLINQTPDYILEKLITEINKIDKDIINRISEIRYYPTKVDEELFYLTMSDEYYIYINILSFSKMNNYLEIIKGFDNKKGIIHLDSGDFLDIYEEEKEQNSNSNKQSNSNQNNSNVINSNSNASTSNSNTSNANEAKPNENDIDDDLERVEGANTSSNITSNKNDKSNLN